MNSPNLANPPGNAGSDVVNAAKNPSPNANPQNRRFAHGRRNNQTRGGPRNPQSSFKPKLKSVESLNSSDKKKRQDFSKFQKPLNHHIMTTYKNSKDLSRCIMDFTKPIQKIEKERKSLINIQNLDTMYATEPPKTRESAKDKFI